MFYVNVTRSKKYLQIFILFHFYKLNLHTNIKINRTIGNFELLFRFNSLVLIY